MKGTDTMDTKSVGIRSLGTRIWCPILAGLCLLSACEKNGVDQSTSAASVDQATYSEGRNSADNEAPAIPVETLTITKAPYKEYGEYYGDIRGAQTAELKAFAGGRVKSVEVAVGKSIKAGRKLCNIDGEKMDILFESAELAERIAAEKNSRIERHLASGTSSRLNADQARMDLLQAKSNRVAAEKNRDGAYCISPIDGVVVAKHIENYQDLNPGQPTMTVASLDKVKLIVGLPESTLDGYEEGRQVVVTVGSHPGKSWTGSIESIAQSVDAEDRTFKAEITILNDDRILKPGMTARAQILRYDLKDRIVIPTEAIMTLADRRVVLIEKDGVAIQKNITVQSSNEQQTLIASGLALGDNLIVKGHTQASDGARLQITSR